MRRRCHSTAGHDQLGPADGRKHPTDLLDGGLLHDEGSGGHVAHARHWSNRSYEALRVEYDATNSTSATRTNAQIGLASFCTSIVASGSPREESGLRIAGGCSHSEGVSETKRPPAWLKGLAWAVGVAAVSWAARSGRLDGPLRDLVAYLEQAGLVGMGVFGALDVAWVGLLLPGFILTLVAGATYGPWVGAAITIPATIGGSGLAYLVGRTLLGSVVERRVAKSKKWQALVNVLSDQGFWPVLLLRLTPMVPYNILNVVMGGSRIPVRTFLVATALGIIPNTFLWLFVGASLGAELTVESGLGTMHDTAAWARWVGLGAAVVLAGITTIWAKRAFGRLTQDLDAS